MYNILFSFLKPQIAFGGDSGGGGGGGGGGSRADRKGAQAILTTPTAPTPVITFNDNDNRRDPAPLYNSNVYDVANIYNDDNEDYTPTSAELNAQLADLGSANMTDDYSIVDYSTTASGNPFIPAAIADSDGGGYMAPIGQNTQSEALIGQATDIGGGVYDPINILSTDAYQLGTGNAIMPPPVYDPLDDSNAFTSRNATNAFDTADIYSEPVVDTYDPLDNDFVDRNPTNAFDVADIYSNNELATSVYDQPADEMDFVPEQGPVQAAPPPPPGDEMDFVPRQGPSPMLDFFKGDFDNANMDLSSPDANFYDEIPNDFDNYAPFGNDSGMEMNLNSPDANFYDDNDFQPDPINDILAGEEFTTSAANVPASIPVQTADDGYFQRVPDQYNLAASESNRFIPDETLASIDFDQSSRFDGYDTSPSVIRDLALGTDTDTDTDTGTAIPTAEDINPTGLSTSQLISSAESKNYDNLTAAEQGALYGQYGQQPNAAEMKQMTEVMTRMRDMPMTEEFQDEVVGQLKADGATDSEISSYRKENPIGENVNPFWKRFGELEGFLPKVLRGIENAAMFGIKNLTMGIIDPAKMDKDMATKYMDALQETGTYDYNDPNYLDISDSKKGNANFDKILEMSGRGPEDYEATNILRGVKDAEGNTVAGFNQYQNTVTGYDPKTGEYESGAVVYNEEERDEDRDNDRCPEGFYFDLIEQMCMPIIDEGADGGSSSPRLTIGRRPTPTQPDPRPPVVRPPSGGTGAAGVNFRQPKFFKDGGSVTPNIDSFLSGLR